LSSAVDTLIAREPSALKPIVRLIFVRLLWSVPTLVFITFLTFLIGELAPGDAATALAGEKASPEAVARLRHSLGLDQPLLVRYGRFVVNACHLDFGQSWFPPYRPVGEIVSEGMGFSQMGLLALAAVFCCAAVWVFVRFLNALKDFRAVFWFGALAVVVVFAWQIAQIAISMPQGRTGPLAIYAILLASAMGVFFGFIAGIWHGKWPDRFATTFSTLGVCIPTFVLAPVLVLIFALKLQVLPDTWVENPKEGVFWYLVLPVLILAMRPAAVITRLTRASMMDVLSQDFIRTASAKGVPFWKVMTKHAFRNSLVTVVTAIGTSFGFLLTGSFILETFFRIPGLGLKSIDAIYQGDFPVIQATVLLFAVLFILVNLLVDLILPLLDPRIRGSAA